MLGSAERERGKVRLLSREIIFQEFQPIWQLYLNVTDGRTDRQTSCLFRSPYIFRMKFPTGFTYRNLHGFARFPGDSTALVYQYDYSWARPRGPSFKLGTLSTRIASRAARSDVDLFIVRTADTRHDLPTEQPDSQPNWQYPTKSLELHRLKS